MQELIGRGITANDGTGDTAREAGRKINENFTALFNAVASVKTIDDQVLNPENSIEDEIASKINAGSSFVFNFANLGYIKYIEKNQQGVVKNIYVLKLIGVSSGSFGANGTIVLASENLLLIGRKNINVEDIEGLANTEIIDLGDIGTTSVLDYVNGISPSITIQNTSTGQTIIKAIVNSEPISYLFVGSGGDYGSLDNTLLESDLELIEQVSNITVVQTLQQVIDAQVGETTAKFKTGVLLEDKPTEDLFAFILGTKFFGFKDGEFYIDAPFRFQNSTVSDQGKILQFDSNGNLVMVNKPPEYGRVHISTSRNLSATDNNKTLIIDGIVTLTFPATLPEDFNFNFKVKTGGTLTIANGSKTLIDTEENVQTQIVAEASFFGTVYQFDTNTFIVEGL